MGSNGPGPKQRGHGQRRAHAAPLPGPPRGLLLRRWCTPPPGPLFLYTVNLRQKTTRRFFFETKKLTPVKIGSFRVLVLQKKNEKIRWFAFFGLSETLPQCKRQVSLTMTRSHVSVQGHLQGNGRGKNWSLRAQEGCNFGRKRLLETFPRWSLLRKGGLGRKNNQKKKKPALNAASGAPTDSLRHGVVCSLASLRFVCKMRGRYSRGKGRLSP